jgi:HSP20 family protein
MVNDDEKDKDKKEIKTDLKNEDMENKVQYLENKIKELEQKLDERKTTDYEHASFVGDIVGLIPGFGRIVKVLEKTSPEFRQKVSETDMEIKHRLETGWSSKPVVSYGLSIRPLSSINESSNIPGAVSQRKKVILEDSELVKPIFDVFENQDFVYVIVQIPGVEEKDINIEIQNDMLDISAGIYSKKISLPCKSGKIEEKSYKNGVLQLKIKREKDVN